MKTNTKNKLSDGKSIPSKGKRNFSRSEPSNKFSKATPVNDTKPVATSSETAFPSSSSLENVVKKLYYNEPILTGSVDKIATFQVLGYPISLQDCYGTDQKVGNNLGAIQVIYLRAALGHCPINNGQSNYAEELAKNPINQAAFILYNKIRGTYTSTLPFEPNDLALYLLSIANIIALAGHIKRGLRILNSASVISGAIPGGLMNALYGVNSAGQLSSVRRNYASTKSAFNLAISRLAGFSVPNGLPLFDRAAMLFDKVYVDTMSESGGGLIAFAPQSLFKFNDAVPMGNNKTAGGCDSIGIGRLDPDSLVNILNEMIDQIQGDDDMRIISAWMQKYYGNSVYSSDYLLAGETLDLDDSKLVEDQVRNLVCITTYDSNAKVKQVGPNLTYDGLNLSLKETNTKKSAGSDAYLYDIVANFPHKPNEYEMINAFQLTTSVKSYQLAYQAGFRYYETYCGLWAACKIAIFRSGYYGSSLVETGNVVDAMSEDYSRVVMGGLTQFNISPVLYFIKDTGDALPTLYPDIAGPIDEYFKVTGSNIESIHQVSILSLMGMPNMKVE